MFEAIAVVLWLTVEFAVQFTAAMLALLIFLLENLARFLAWLARVTWALILDARAWRRAAPELAVRDYPEPKRERPLATAPLPPRELKR